MASRTEIGCRLGSMCRRDIVNKTIATRDIKDHILQIGIGLRGVQSLQSSIELLDTQTAIGEGNPELALYPRPI